MKKKVVAIILILSFALSGVLCGCAPAGTLQPDSEEMPVDIYSEEYYLEQAKTLGISWDELYDDLDAKMTYKDLSRILQNAFGLFYSGERSKFLEFQDANFSNEEAKWGYAVNNVFYMDSVRNLDLNVNDDSFWSTACDAQRTWNVINDYSLVEKLVKGNEMRTWDAESECTVNIDLPAGTVVYPESVWAIMTNEEELSNYGTNWVALAYCIAKYDRVSGEHLAALDADLSFPASRCLTNREAILLAFHYYRSIEPDGDYVPIEELGTYDKSIITDELLNKESTLPEASGAKLPAEWQGVNLCYKGNCCGALSGAPDSNITKREIEEIKETGFNFMRIFVSWWRMREPDYPRGEVINENILREIDQILAWSMENNIHVQLVFNETPGLHYADYDYDWGQWMDAWNNVFSDKAEQELTAKYWGALSRRYAEIPNKYLSFNLMNECDPESDEIYAEAMKPTIEAIWAAAPERIIVADVSTHTPITGDEMAKLGVCLAFHDYYPGDFCVYDAVRITEDPEYAASLVWPYVDANGNVIDAEACKSAVPYTVGSIDVVKGIADKYGVGFMINEWGTFLATVERDKMNIGAPREEVYEMYEDKIKMYEENGIGWALEWYGVTCVAEGYPFDIEGAEYIHNAGSKWYLDRNMMTFFQRMNGVEGKETA